MEIEVSRQRYTESQILFGLREAWQEFTGVNDPFDSHTLIYTFMTSDGSWEELDFADVFRGNMEQCIYPYFHHHSCIVIVH